MSEELAPHSETKIGNPAYCGHDEDTYELQCEVVEDAAPDNGETM